MSIEDRIPQLTDKELENLHDNAERISKGAASKQQVEAARLLPIIAEALVQRSTLRDRRAEVAKEQELADTLLPQQILVRPLLVVVGDEG